MYGKALTGVEVAVHSAEALAGKGIGWVETELPSTEGTSIFLPPHVEEFSDKDQNFGVYKVFCTHQAGHLEFGTFDFQFEREGSIFPPPASPPNALPFILSLPKDSPPQRRLGLSLSKSRNHPSTPTATLTPPATPPQPSTNHSPTWSASSTSSPTAVSPPTS